jgi:hypothetical protein
MMKKKPCKECPWVVRNKHNNTIVEFSKRMGMGHNCHMTKTGKKNLWKVEESCQCLGREIFITDAKSNKENIERV